MKKCVIGIVSVLLVGEMQGEGGLNYFLDSGQIEHVISTPTNVTFKIKTSVLYVEYNPKRPNPFPQLENIPESDPGYILLNLTPDQEVMFGEHHGRHLFTPVSFKDQQKGFRILALFRWGKETTNAVAYVAFGDTLMEGNGDDVEMIMEKGEWKKYEKPPPVPKTEDEVQETPPIPDEPVTAAPDETPVNIAEDEQDEGRATASPPSRLWLYAAIALCALSAVLWLARKKRT